MVFLEIIGHDDGDGNPMVMVENIYIYIYIYIYLYISIYISVKDRHSFHRVDTIGNIFTSGCATRENITDGVHSMK